MDPMTSHSPSREQNVVQGGPGIILMFQYFMIIMIIMLIASPELPGGSLTMIIYTPGLIVQVKHFVKACR